jgi:hypothetical protein
LLGLCAIENAQNVAEGKKIKKKLVCIKDPPLHQASCEYNIQGARGKKKNNLTKRILCCPVFLFIGQLCHLL